MSDTLIVRDERRRCCGGGMGGRKALRCGKTL